MKAVVAAFNQEKALVGAFSVLTNIRMELFQALIYINIHNIFTQYFYLPTTPDTPMSSLATKTPMTAVESSGAELPADMKVAPATSGLRPSTSDIRSSAGTKYSSHTIASPGVDTV